MSAVDNIELKNADIKDYNKKKRYEIRYEMEDHYRDKNNILKDKKEEKFKNKFSYNKFKELDSRGFNILNNNEVKEDYKNKLNFKDTIGTWDKMLKYANEASSTFKNKTIFRHPYDTTEVEENTKKFRKDREGK
jgi:hypothetical protein